MKVPPLDAQNEPNFHLTMSHLLTFFPNPGCESQLVSPTPQSKRRKRRTQRAREKCGTKRKSTNKPDKETCQRQQMKSRLWQNSEHILTNGWVEIKVVENLRENGKDWGWWWCILLTSDHGRGPVGDYWGLASFNLAPPPHQGIKHAANILFNCNL